MKPPGPDGLALTLFSLVLWGLYGIPLNGAVRHLPPATVGAVAFLTSGLLLVLARAAGIGAAPSPLAIDSGPALPGRGFLWSVAAGCLSAAALVLMLRAFEIRGIARTTPIVNLNTFVAVLGGMVVFGERLSVRGWIGVLLAAAGGYLVQTGGK